MLQIRRMRQIVKESTKRDNEPLDELDRARRRLSQSVPTNKELSNHDTSQATEKTQLEEEEDDKLRVKPTTTEEEPSRKPQPQQQQQQQQIEEEEEEPSRKPLQPEEAPSPPPRPRTKEDGVAFSTVQVREYGITAGDNPAAARGVPLTIVWKHSFEFTVDLETFERNHKPRRSIDDMQITSLDRVLLLKRQGHSRIEIKEAMQEADAVRERRKQTHQSMRFSEIEAGMELLKRSLWNRTVGRQKKREEQAYLSEFTTENSRERRASVPAVSLQRKKVPKYLERRYSL